MSKGKMFEPPVPIITGHGQLADTVSVLLVAIVGYVIYYHYLHPLARYPGPFIASFTNLWKTYQLWNLHMPEVLAQLHEEYGDVVRVGPKDLSFNTGTAAASIYKAGRVLPKIKFYNGFTTFNPNLFGTQDDEIHALRRRQMAHTFSLQSIKEMEPFIDKHISILCANLDHCADTGRVFDLKDLISYYMLDTLGELAFSRTFDAQTEQVKSKLPPIDDHIFLACLLGQLPEMMPALKLIAAYTPIPWFQRLFRARMNLKHLTADCVRRRLNEKISDRKDLLTCLIKAEDPNTGAKLTELDINTEAFAFIIAGSHTTSDTLTFLFSHLLQNEPILQKVVSEIDLRVSNPARAIVPIEGLEQNLAYTMACIQENFRINPVFSMPLPRKVTPSEGMDINGHQVPEGTTVFSLNYVVHHNRSIWGEDHDTFDPSRFLGPNADDLKRNLSPFSVGHRMCIGKNMAMTNILKVVTTVLKNYELKAENPEQDLLIISVGISQRAGPLLCRVRKRT